MKQLQIFSKYLIWFSIIWIPILWFWLQAWWYMWANIFGTSPYQLFFDLSLLAVFFLMIIRPLADIFSKKKKLRQLVFLRKSFGIFSAMIIATIMVSWWIENPELTFFNYFSSDKWQLWYPLVARVSEFSAIILLLTSNIFSMKKLGKNWKRIQYLAYPYFFSWAIIAARWEHAYMIYIMIWIVILLWIWAEILRYKKRA
jgi:sulfoxide reductase heme-binding subunit YedZ